MKLFLFSCLPLSLILLPAAPGTAAIWTAGHGDFAVAYTGGALPQFTASRKVGTGGEPGEVDGNGCKAPPQEQPCLTGIQAASTAGKVPPLDAGWTGGGHGPLPFARHWL